MCKNLVEIRTKTSIDNITLYLFGRRKIMLTYFIIAAIGGYLLGSVPFGLVLTKLAGTEDIRKIGSKSIGATNVLRTGRKDLAILTVILDASKAGIAAYIAYRLVPINLYTFFGFETSTATFAGLLAGTFGIIGHSFPVWLKFKGGKGVASAFGFFLAIDPFVALLALITWLLTALITRYSSLSAIIAALLIPFYSLQFCNPVNTIFYTAIVILVLARHRANFVRLFKGTETKISFKKKK